MQAAPTKHLYVVKRDGRQESMKFDKITARLAKVMDEACLTDIDPAAITQLLASRVATGMSTAQIDELACQILMSKVQTNHQYGRLAAYLGVSNCHKTTPSSFQEVVNILKANIGPGNTPAPLISLEIIDIMRERGEQIEKMIDYQRDYRLDHFGLATLKKAYLTKSKGQIVERPQHMFMRVALGIHGNNLECVKKTYDGLSLQKYMHATPTLFHAGMPRAQMASCFLIGTDDSVEGIYGTITSCAKISKWGGGIGAWIHPIRSEGSYIRKTGGSSDGILPMLRVYNSTARYINQSGKRNGSFAMYIEPWHADILSFLDAKKAQGVEEERARDLFYALWIPDLFMQRVKNGGTWSLMCPDTSPGLCDVYGEDFNKLYTRYESEGKFVSQMPARVLWERITVSQIESGVPYMCYKDAANEKSNQKNLGTIKSSNLCAEIIEYSTPDEPAVCNLASISLPSILVNIPLEISSISLITKAGCFYCDLLKSILTEKDIPFQAFEFKDAPDYLLKDVPSTHTTFPQVFLNLEMDDCTVTEFVGGFFDIWEDLRPKVDWDLLRQTAYELCENLNAVIDRGFYPLEGARQNNLKHRPIGIGVQGLADLFARLLIPFDSPEGADLNKKIFETIYYGAMQASVDLAEKHGPYESFAGSPLSEGKFQFDLWNPDNSELSGMWDWKDLKAKVLTHGARNSLLTALMPTASTAQILGNNECFEPYTSNLFVRSTIAGEFTMVNEILVDVLIKAKMWTQEMQDKITFHRGSVQEIQDIPKTIRNVFKTVWEISQKEYIKMSASRGPFICQSQSLNLWFDSPNFKRLYNAHMLGWSLGLKTGSYYVRQLPASAPQRLGMSAKQEQAMQTECENCSA